MNATADPPVGKDADLIERLRARLPVCPFSDHAPKHDLEAGDPCPVCGDYGDERSKNLCHGADTRIMDEAADRLSVMEEALRSAERAIRYGLEAIESQRSEPLSIARDTFRNWLDDNAALAKLEQQE